MSPKVQDLWARHPLCGWPSTRVHTRKTGRVDDLWGRASTRLPKPAEFLRVDVWTMWTPYKGGPAASTCRHAVLPREGRT